MKNWPSVLWIAWHSCHKQWLLIGHHSQVHWPCPLLATCFLLMCTSCTVEIVRCMHTLQFLDQRPCMQHRCQVCEGYVLSRALVHRSGACHLFLLTPSIALYSIFLHGKIQLFVMPLWLPRARVGVTAIISAGIAVMGEIILSHMHHPDWAKGNLHACTAHQL